MTLFTLAQVEEAWSQLPRILQNTPFHRARTPGLFLKLESLQPTGSYKIRAAYLALKTRGTGQKVALSSSGNFAIAFTWAAAQLGVEAHLVVTPSVNPEKLAWAQHYPCQVHRSQDDYESRFTKLQDLAALGIEVIDHRADHGVFLGHSTIGWECLQHQQCFDRILLPVSTGGLALGVAVALRAGGYKGEIVGVCPAGNPTLYASWQAGSPTKTDRASTICDALSATSIAPETFGLLQTYLDDVLVVQEQSVQEAIGFLALQEGLVAEPGACVGVAALLEHQRPWTRSLCLLSGRNLEQGVLVDGLDLFRQRSARL